MNMMNYRSIWLFGGIAAVLAVIAFWQTLSYHRQRECQLELENARLAERLFLRILRNEIDRDFPNQRFEVNASGGANQADGRYELTTLNDVFFEQPVPLHQLQNMVSSLSGNGEIADWVSLAEPKRISRFCQFHVIGRSDRPYVRMLMHESNQPGGITNQDLRRLFSGDYYQKLMAGK